MSLLDGAELKMAVPNPINDFFTLIAEEVALLRMTKRTDITVCSHGSYSALMIIRGQGMCETLGITASLEIEGMKLPDDIADADLDALVELFSGLACPSNGADVIKLIFKAPDARLSAALARQRFSRHVGNNGPFMMKGAANLVRDRTPTLKE